MIVVSSHIHNIHFWANDIDWRLIRNLKEYIWYNNLEYVGQEEGKSKGQRNSGASSMFIDTLCDLLNCNESAKKFIRIAKNSGIIFSAYWKYFFVRHSSVLSVCWKYDSAILGNSKVFAVQNICLKKFMFREVKSQSKLFLNIIEQIMSDRAFLLLSKMFNVVEIIWPVSEHLFNSRIPNDGIE